MNFCECLRCQAGFCSSTNGKLCADCLALDHSASPVSHHRLLRCSSCRAISRIESFSLAVLREGAHLVDCLWCGEKFEVCTVVQRRFLSPATT